MPQKVYNVVVDYRVVDNGRVAEDITSIGLPNLEFKTTTISSNGMVADVDMPNYTQLNALEFSVNHNNGVNCRYLSDPGKHTIETRIARQRYNVPEAVLGHEGAKIRVTGIPKGVEHGTLERNNPYGSTVKYTVVRYEEELNGEVIALIDAMAGIVRINGKDYSSEIESLLS